MRTICKYCGKEITGKIYNGAYCSGSCQIKDTFRNKFKLNSKDISIVKSLNISSISTNNNIYKIYGYGYLVKLSKQMYLDQLSGSVKVHSSYFKEYILSEYNLTEKEYYNIVIYGDINYKRLCKNCGRELPFLGLNLNPDRSYRYYCNAKCETSYRINTNTYHFQKDNRYKIPSMIEHDINASIRGKERFKNGIHEFQNIDNTLLMSKNQFLRIFKDNRGYLRAKLYWALLGGEDNSEYFKIGVTTSSLNSRKNHIREGSIPYRTIHLLYEGDIDLIANLEYKIKIKFKEYRICPSTEIFPINKFREIISYLSDILNKN